jgi:hypothetical protein
MDCDPVLLASARDQSKFLAWRRGVFGWGRKCACGKCFNRGHTKCMPFPSGILSPHQLLLYDMDIIILGDGIKYTIMDFLLNQRDWRKAQTLLDYWYSTMVKHL